jgi:glycosyltransferase involved in cell wall biosynthesis
MNPPWKIPLLTNEERAALLAFTATAIVSTYKSEEFMRGCLEDLVGQSLFGKGELEILVIDSGSPENERAIVEEFQGKYPNIVYVRTEREPLYAAWNRAIPLARGRYLTNANTDDRHRKDALEVMARALDARAEVAIVYGDMVMTSEPNRTFENPGKGRLFRWKDYSRMELLGDQRCGPQPMWRKELHWELGGFCEEFRVASDYEWWCRVAERYPMLRIPEALGLYLKRPDSIEHRQLEICEKETELIQRFYRARMEGFDARLISQRPKKALPRFFWRMKRSILKRVRSS